LILFLEHEHTQIFVPRHSIFQFSIPVASLKVVCGYYYHMYMRVCVPLLFGHIGWSIGA